MITPGTRTCGVLDGNDAGSSLDMVDSSARYLIAFSENVSLYCFFFFIHTSLCTCTWVHIRTYVNN